MPSKRDGRPSLSPSASSSRRVVVPASGAPAPPERVPSEGTPAGAVPNPTSRRNRFVPLEGIGGEE